MDSKQLFDLEGSHSIVTGAAKGNGRAIADALYSAGSETIGVDWEFAGDSAEFETMGGDVCADETIAAVRARIQQSRPSHLVLVNNAGVTFPCEGKYPLDKWRQTLDVNLTAPFRWIEGLADLFRDCASGSVINITSLGAERAFPNNPAYIASKGGLKMLTRYYAKELGADGIRVNNVGPGYMLTDMTRKGYENDSLRRAREQQTLLKRWGQPADLQGVVIFLASDASSYVTGQDIYVDGGWLTNGLIEELGIRHE